MICLRDESGKLFRPALIGGVCRNLIIRDLEHTRQYTRESVKLTPLFIANPTDDLPGTQTEVEEIRKRLQQSGRVDVDDDERFFLVGKERATKENVLKLLKTYAFDFIHYAGHGYYDEGKDESGLTFPDGNLTPKDLKKIELRQPAALVVLNACQTARISRQSHLLNANLGVSILKSGVAGFLSNQWVIKDNSAADFAATVYLALWAGKSLGEAILEARNQLYDQDDPNWANYVFYGSPDIRL